MISSNNNNNTNRTFLTEVQKQRKSIDELNAVKAQLPPIFDAIEDIGETAKQLLESQEKECMETYHQCMNEILNEIERLKDHLLLLKNPKEREERIRHLTQQTKYYESSLLEWNRKNTELDASLALLTSQFKQLENEKKWMETKLEQETKLATHFQQQQQEEERFAFADKFDFLKATSSSSSSKELDGLLYSLTAQRAKTTCCSSRQQRALRGNDWKTKSLVIPKPMTMSSLFSKNNRTSRSNFSASRKSVFSRQQQPQEEQQQQQQQQEKEKEKKQEQEEQHPSLERNEKEFNDSIII